jgi:hypothetical protein
MTAKQKANRERFKKVVAEAKKLRAKNPKLTQPQAVKQAWAILYKGGKMKKKKVGDVYVTYPSKKEGEYKMMRNHKGEFKGNVRISSSKSVTQGKLFGSSKPTKVKTTKSKKTGEMHTDTKSHNVNIRVLSGIAHKQKEMALKAWKDVYGKLAAEYISAKTEKEKNIIKKELKIAKIMIANFSK